MRSGLGDILIYHDGSIAPPAIGGHSASECSIHVEQKKACIRILITKKSKADGEDDEPENDARTDVRMVAVALEPLEKVAEG